MTTIVIFYENFDQNCNFGGQNFHGNGNFSIIFGNFGNNWNSLTEIGIFDRNCHFSLNFGENSNF